MIVYITTNLVSERKYIGSTSKTYDEAVKAKYLGSQAELRSDIDKLGADKFTFEVIEQCNDLNHCRERELYHHNLNDVAKSPMFYNKKHGHFGAKNYRYTGEQSKNLSRAHKGVKRTATTKKLAGINLKGAERSQLTTAKIRLTKLKKQVRESSGIRMRGLSYEIRIQVYGTQCSYYYGKAHDFEAVRQSLRDIARPIIKAYEEDVWRLEQGEMIRNLDKDITIVPYVKPILTQRGYTQCVYNDKLFASQYSSSKHGKTKVVSCGVHPSSFAARLACLKMWNKKERIEYTNAELVDLNVAFFKTMNEKLKKTL